MRFNKMQLFAWIITAEALRKIDTDELELLVDIIETAHVPSKNISAMPGAFDFDVCQIQSIAVVIFQILVDNMKDILPKIFDESLEVSRNMLGDIIYGRKDMGSQSRFGNISGDPNLIYQIVHKAALDRKLSGANADAIANAVLAKLVLDCNT